jgi:hypothetical protein
MTQQSTAPIQAPFTEPCYGAGSIVIDKTGTIFQVWTGRVSDNGPWGPRVFRTVRGGRPELVWFIEGCNGNQLAIMNKQLYLSYTPPHSGQWLQKIDGYIDPLDTPSSQVVNVDESALNAVRNSIFSVGNIANHAADVANASIDVANASMGNVQQLKARVTALEQQLQLLQTQTTTTQQMTDILWSKLWDVVYLLRMGMNAGKSDDANIQGWVNDLTRFVKKVK